MLVSSPDLFFSPWVMNIWWPAYSTHVSALEYQCNHDDCN